MTGIKIKKYRYIMILFCMYPSDCFKYVFLFSYILLQKDTAKCSCFKQQYGVGVTRAQLGWTSKMAF